MELEEAQSRWRSYVKNRSPQLREAIIRDYAILDALRQLDWVPRSVRVKEQNLRRAYGRLESVFGRPPRDEEVAEELGVDMEAFEQLVTEVARGSVLSLDDLVAGMGESTTL